MLLIEHELYKIYKMGLKLNLKNKIFCFQEYNVCTKKIDIST